MMNEFIRPKRIIVDSIPYMRKITKNGLIKDLHNNEELCKTCEGTGVIIMNNPYGLSDDPDKSRLFPYKHQAYTLCPDCYNGIVHKCKLCGEIIRPRWNLKCTCAAQQALDDEEREKVKKEAFDKAEELPDNLKDNYEYFSSEYYTYNEGFFDDWDSFFDDWNENHEGIIERPQYVWIAEPISLNIDALDIIENATSELYEDVMADISDSAIGNLQQFLNEWCKTCGAGNTYHESHRYKVKIPWEKYGKIDKKIIFATKNRDKIKETKKIMKDIDVNIVSMKESGIDMDIEEDGRTYRENAVIKAKAVWNVSGGIVFADDSGFEIDYLNKEPGLYSARYLGENIGFNEKCDDLLKRMNGVPDEKRTARFICAIAIVFPDGSIETVQATVEGRVAHRRKGRNGFGYDPIFYLPEYGCTSAELLPEEKNKISHRRKALEMMKKKIKEVNPWK